MPATTRWRPSTVPAPEPRSAIAGIEVTLEGSGAGPTSTRAGRKAVASKPKSCTVTS